MTELRTPVSEPGLREQATIRLRKKSEFRAHLLAYVLCNAFLLTIWALTGTTGFFWPAFPLLGWASAGSTGPPVHLRQRQDGSVLVGERTQETVAADPSGEHARALLAQAARFFPALRGVPVRRRILAWRAMPADRLPIVGPVPWLDTLYVAVTHSGVTVAPALGRLAALEVATGEPAGRLAPFRPGRFAERASRVLLEVESAFRERPRQRPSL